MATWTDRDTIVCSAKSPVVHAGTCLTLAPWAEQEHSGGGGLAVLGSLVAIVNEIVHFRQTGAVDSGHVALIVGVPVLMYAIVAKRQT